MIIPSVIRAAVSGSSSGASLVGGVLTVNGSGFGSKSAPGPLVHLTFEGNSSGDDYLEAGYDYYNQDGSGGRLDFTVDKSADVGIAPNHGAMKHYYSGLTENDPAGQSFPHGGFFIPGDQDQLFVSHYTKIIQLTGPALSAAGQMKTHRLGDQNGITLDNDCGIDVYNSTGAKIYINHFDGTGATTEEVNWRSQSTFSNDFANLGSRVDFLDDAYHQLESWTVYNTVGNANGILRYWQDGQLRRNSTNAQPKTSSGEHIDWCTPYPGLTGGYGNGASFDVWCSNIYIDNTLSRVCLINASSVASATSRLPVSATSWSDTQIIADVVGRPTGYDWVAVFDSSGNSQVFSL